MQNYFYTMEALNMDCIKLQTCPFYNDKMPMDQGIGAIFKNKYCSGNNEICARYKVLNALGPAFVPSTLYPNMHDIAEKILAEAKSK